MNTNVTLLEYVNEYGNWVFYGVYASRDPRNAVENYLAENDLDKDDPEIKEQDGEVWVEDVCRAYEVELE